MHYRNDSILGVFSGAPIARETGLPMSGIVAIEKQVSAKGSGALAAGLGVGGILLIWGMTHTHFNFGCLAPSYR